MALTIEELMGMKPPREEFVTAPVREEKIKQIFKEEASRNAAAGSDTKITNENGKTKVDSGVIEVAGIMDEKPLSPVNTPKAEDTVPIQTEQPLRERLGFEPIKREPTAVQPTKKDASFPWDRALVGATPLLVGLMTGNKLEGVQTSANYFTNTEEDLRKRELDLNAKLAQLKDKVANGGSKRYVAQNIALADGTTVKAAFDSYTGKYFMPDGKEIPSNFIRSGYAVTPEEHDRRVYLKSEVKRADADALGQGTRVSPVDGQLAMVRNGRLVPIEGQNSGTLTVKQQSDREKLSKEWLQNPVVKGVIPVARSAQSLQDLLRSGKPVSQAAAKTLLARMSGEVGNLSEMEQAIYQGSPSLVARAERWMNLQATDKPLTASEVQDLIEIAQYYAKSSNQILNTSANEMRRIGIEDYNLPQDTVERIISPTYAPMKEQFERGAQKAKQSSVNFKGETYFPPDPYQTLAVEVNGKLFWTSDKWEDVKRDHPNAKRLN